MCEDSIKSVRDQLEHPGSPMSMRGIRSGEGVTAETWKVVRVGEDPITVQFEPARELREAIHSYVNAMVDLLEGAGRSSTSRVTGQQGGNTAHRYDPIR